MSSFLFPGAICFQILFLFYPISMSHRKGTILCLVSFDIPYFSCSLFILSSHSDWVSMSSLASGCQKIFVKSVGNPLNFHTFTSDNRTYWTICMYIKNEGDREK